MMQRSNFLALGSTFLALTTAIFSASALEGRAQAQPAETKPSPIAATAPTVVPPLVPYAGIAMGADGKILTAPVNATFLLFKDEAGGEPLWAETQTVAPDAAGHYQVQLGASAASGLPLNTFANGEGRWLEVQIAGERPGPRVLLMSVPYAMKAADAATLGGLPASAYALAGAMVNPAIPTSATGAAVSPDTASTVTTTGGTSGYLPVYSGATTIDDSIVFESGTKIGIGTKAPAATLDIEGAIIARGLLTMENTGTATASAGNNSQAIEWLASAYSSSTGKATAPAFTLQAEAAGNNTSAPAATLNLRYGNGGTPAETGFSINSKGIVKFATGQTFPGVATGDITGVTAGSGLTGGGTSGTVTLAVDTTKIPTLTDNPTFTGHVTVNGASTALIGNGTSVGVSGISSSGIGVQATATTGKAIYAHATSGTGILSETQSGVAGTFYASNESTAVSVVQNGDNTGTTADGIDVSSVSGSGIHAIVERASGEYVDYPLNAALWGDFGGGDEGAAQAGVLGTSDYGIAGLFYGGGNVLVSLSFYNYQDPETVFYAGSIVDVEDQEPGYCDVNTNGDLTCIGTISGTINSQTENGVRKVQTYAVQSTENWFEDFGSGTLNHGAAKISIENGFAHIINSNVEYHVFLTPNGDCKGLYVSAKTGNGFEVHELGGGSASIPFEYRIVAKRSGYEQLRLQDVTDRVNKEQARLAPVSHGHKPRPTAGQKAALVPAGLKP